jgi:hypothetical protein
MSQVCRILTFSVVIHPEQFNVHEQVITIFSFLTEPLTICIFSITPGKYYYLPNASDAVISAATKEALSEMKSSY